MWSFHSASGTSLLAEIAADPHLPVVASVSGPGGSGKSALLDDLEAHYRAVGVTVSRQFDSYEGGVLLIDDAHRLSDGAIARLRELLAAPDCAMIVASRPWTNRDALRDLIVELDGLHPPVALGPLSRDQIADYVELAAGDAVPAALVDLIAEQTSGMPWLVQRVVASTVRPGAPLPSAPTVGQDVIDHIGHELDVTNPQLHSLLLALAVGFELSSALPPSAALSLDRLDAEVLAAMSAGLMTADARLVPLVARTLLDTSAPYRVRAVQRELVDSYLLEGRPLDAIARVLARSGLHDTRIASALETLADRALAVDPALAAELYEEADLAAAGSATLALAARRAQAAYGMGDLDAACRIVDELVATDNPPDLGRAIDTSAAVWAQRGALSRSAQMYSWLGVERMGASVPLAVVALVGTGDLGSAMAMQAATSGEVLPTQLDAALGAMAEGVLESVAGEQSVALSSLVRASDMLTGSGAVVPTPETPAALAALVAMHTGELEVAGSVLDAAIAGEQGGNAARRRLVLLQAWSAMLAEQPERARGLIALAVDRGSSLPPRDQLLWHSLEVGLARRSDDAAALLHAWQRARESLLHVPVDLFSLLPLGELIVAAARLRDSVWLETHLAEAWSLLEKLGDPPVWSVMLRWSAVQAGILLDRPADLAPHAAALVRASGNSRLAAVLSAAGREWITVLAGEVDVLAVELAAKGLASAGLPWDGSRLAGHAAARAVDRRDMSKLLSVARDLHPRPRVPRQHDQRPAGRDATGLSQREKEVARLVLEGMTYREIGDAIFVSPRTAEHHIAQIRRRLGAANRSDLLAKLRTALGLHDVFP